MSAAFLQSAAAGGGEAAAELPVGAPIVVISIDTLRSDRLPAYGYEGVETPAIDALRADGILYERAYSPVPLTLPAHASLFTGLLPGHHGVRDNVGYRLGEEVAPLLPERLRRHGYQTGAAVSSFVLRAGAGLARGFDFYDDRFERPERATAADIMRDGPATLEAAMPWLRSVAGRPFFLFFHIYEPHVPYRAPEPFSSRYASGYDAEIAAADAVVRDLVAELKRLDLYDSALIVLLSDHGEGLGDHGEPEHGILLYREVLQVPLIVKLPGAARRGASVARAVQLIDVPVTILGLVGDPVAAELPGRSLLAPPPEEEPLIYGESYYPQFHYGWSHLLSAISGRHHFIYGPDPELYDLVEDPAERRNLLPEQLPMARRLRHRMRALESPPTPPYEADAKTRRALESLGYLASSASRRKGPPRDPKAYLGTLDAVNEGLRVLAAGNPQLAVERFRAALDANPDLLDAWQFLGLALRNVGEREEALTAFKQAYRLSNGAPALAPPLAQLLVESGEPGEALEILQAATVVSPDDAGLPLLQARVLDGLGRHADALTAVESSLAKAPGEPAALYLRGAIRMATDDASGAEIDFRQVLAIEPGHREAARDLAVLLMETGRAEEAGSVLEAAGREAG